MKRMMKRIVKILRSCCLSVSVVAAGLGAAATASRADTITDYPITMETQIDSQAPTANFGAGTSAKVVVNGQDGSLARALFKVPDAAWSVSSAELVSAKVCFYLWADQTQGRDVRLHPLTEAFVEGTGSGAQTNDGATWYSRDGIQTWTTAGGDFDPGLFVDAVKPADGYGWFTWDITSLWDDPNLGAYGAILKMSDESDPGYPNMPRAPFTSHESTQYPHPYVEITTVTAVPEPATGVMLLAGSLLALGAIRLRRRRSLAAAE